MVRTVPFVAGRKFGTCCSRMAVLYLLGPTACCPKYLQYLSFVVPSVKTWNAQLCNTSTTESRKGLCLMIYTDNNYRHHYIISVPCVTLTILVIHSCFVRSVPFKILWTYSSDSYGGLVCFHCAVTVSSQLYRAELSRAF